MYFLFKDWSCIASRANTHPSIFQESRVHHVVTNGRSAYQDDEFLATFLKLCDLTGKRALLHQNELKDQLKTQKMKHTTYRVRQLIMGDHWSDKRIEKLVPDSCYPLPLKPLIKTVPAANYHFKYNPDLQVYELGYEEELKILKEAEGCDILLLGHGNCLDSLYSDDKVCLTKITNHKSTGVLLPKLTQVHVHKRVHGFDMCLRDNMSRADQWEYTIQFDMLSHLAK